MNTYDYHRRLSDLEVKYLQAKEIYAQAQADQALPGPHLTRLKYQRDFLLVEIAKAQKDLDEHLKRETETQETQQPKQTPIYENWGEFS